jgi:sirohydrochlorin ferrochelatase
MPDIFINTRQAIPVRLSPFLTGWHFSPDIMARILAARDTFHDVRLSSFHLLPEGTHYPMLPKECDAVIADLTVLKDSLKAQIPS